MEPVPADAQLGGHVAVDRVGVGVARKGLVKRRVEDGYLGHAGENLSSHGDAQEVGWIVKGGQLDVILTAVAAVSEVAAADVPPTSHPLPLTNVDRPDEVDACLSQAEALARAFWPGPLTLVLPLKPGHGLARLDQIERDADRALLLAARGLGRLLVHLHDLGGVADVDALADQISGLGLLELGAQQALVLVLVDRVEGKARSQAETEKDGE